MLFHAGAFATYLWSATAATGAQLFTLCAPILILAFVMNVVAGFVERRAYSFLGQRLYLVLFGWLGTSVHELGHAAFCVIFRHKIVEMKLFHPNHHGGTLGYVKHSFNPRNPYHVVGNFFIGIGPLIMGTVVIYTTSHYLLGAGIFGALKPVAIDAASFTTMASVKTMLGAIWAGVGTLLSAVFTWENLGSWQLWVFLYITFTVGSSMTLSKPDLHVAGYGLGAFVGLLWMFNMATFWIGDFADRTIAHLSHVFSVYYAVVIFALLMNAIAGVIVLALPGSARAYSAVQRQ